MEESLRWKVALRPLESERKVRRPQQRRQNIEKVSPCQPLNAPETTRQTLKASSKNDLVGLCTSNITSFTLGPGRLGRTWREGNRECTIKIERKRRRGGGKKGEEKRGERALSDYIFSVFLIVANLKSPIFKNLYFEVEGGRHRW